MLLFACCTSEDVIKIYDSLSMRQLCKRDLSDEFEEKVGPRAGDCFGNCTVIGGCYNNNIYIINNADLKIIKKIRVGSYPIYIAGDDEAVYIACGDSNSIWTMNKKYEITYIDNTVRFPYCMAINENELCVGGYANGEICIYDKHDFTIKKHFEVKGYPSGMAYLGQKLFVAYNDECSGRLMCADKVVELDTRVGKVQAYKNRIYLCVDDCHIVTLDERLETTHKLTVKEPIADFAVCNDDIFVSELLGTQIKKFSQDSQELGRINVGHSGCSLIVKGCP